MSERMNMNERRVPKIRVLRYVGIRPSPKRRIDPAKLREFFARKPDRDPPDGGGQSRRAA